VFYAVVFIAALLVCFAFLVREYLRQKSLTDRAFQRALMCLVRKKKRSIYDMGYQTRTLGVRGARDGYQPMCSNLNRDDPPRQDPL